VVKPKNAIAIQNFLAEWRSSYSMQFPNIANR